VKKSDSQGFANVFRDFAFDAAIGGFGTFAAGGLAGQFVMCRRVLAQQLARFGNANALGGAFMRF
jgi:hypothetical protein